ncbi:MAG: prepilin peptidase, partial [Clostridiales bacterium]|nr:prepilin peptidase [Clostridiales bacterium]
LMGLGFSLMFGVVLGGASRILPILGNIIFPVIVLYLLYLVGAVGAGDIKLFSVIGAFTNFRTLTGCMLSAFVIGGVLAALRMILNRNFISSMKGALYYIGDLLRGQRVSYKGRRRQENLMHFSVAILGGLLAVRLGVV